MLNRLVENDITLAVNPSEQKIKWWLCECRNSDMLIKLIDKNKDLAKEYIIKRQLLKVALKKDIEKVEGLLHKEELLERENDRKYWEPLRRELEILRHGLHRGDLKRDGWYQFQIKRGQKN